MARTRAKARRAAPSLEELYLDLGNCIGDTGCASLVAALDSGMMPALQQLMLAAASEEAQAAAHIFLKEEFTTSSSTIEATPSTPATELELFAEFVKTQ